jgi:hypothetical protein
MEELAASDPRIRLLRHERNLGIRDTYEHLYRECTREFVFLNSTDGQCSTWVLADLITRIGEADIVIGKRRNKHYGLGRAFISWALNAIPEVLFGVRVHDAGSVKLTRRELLTRWKLVSRSPFSEAERIIRATRAGCRVVAVPIAFQPRAAGRSAAIRPRVLLDSALDVVRLRWALAPWVGG